MSVSLCGGRIRMALVGLNFGTCVLRDQLLAGPGLNYVETIGVCDLDQEKAAATARRCGLRHYRDFEEVLADPAVEAVGLYTPPHGRAALLRRIIDAGKAAMTTKPFEDDPDAAEELLRYARSRRRLIHLNSPAPLPPGDIAQILLWQREFQLGQPVSAFWETHACYHEQPDGSWMDDPRRCPAAPVFRLGIYGINDLIAVCGRPEAVQVLSSRVATGRPTGDNGCLSIRFANGALGSVAASFLIDDARPYVNTLLVNFQRGSAWRALPAQESCGEIHLRAVGRGGEIIRQSSSIDGANRSGAYQWTEFQRAVRAGETISEEYIGRIIASTRVLDALHRADAASAV